MGVVVNDFEVLPTAPAAPAKKAGEGKDESSKEKLEPCVVSAALRSLEVQTLRSWAH